MLSTISSDYFYLKIFFVVFPEFRQDLYVIGVENIFMKICSEFSEDIFKNTPTIFPKSSYFLKISSSNFLKFFL